MSLGVLSIHLDGAPCAVRCPFCYLGARTAAPVSDRVPVERLRPRAAAPARADDDFLRAAQRLDYAELAIAISEPVDQELLQRARALAQAAAARGKLAAITTTPQVVMRTPEVLAGASRLNLSVDPWKLPGDASELLQFVERAAALARNARVEVIAIATLSTPSFAEALIGAGGEGLLAALVASPALDGVALNALKPPPPFCDRAFWLDALHRLRPLLDRALERRLHLDCYVAARLLGLGACPARPDLSPGTRGRLAFRSCVYAATPDAEVDRIEDLDLADFVAPAVCPFPTRL